MNFQKLITNEFIKKNLITIGSIERFKKRFNYRRTLPQYGQRLN